MWRRRAGRRPSALNSDANLWRRSYRRGTASRPAARHPGAQRSTAHTCQPVLAHGLPSSSTRSIVLAACGKPIPAHLARERRQQTDRAVSLVLRRLDRPVRVGGASTQGAGAHGDLEAPLRPARPDAGQHVTVRTDRPVHEIAAEVQALLDRGVLELAFGQRAFPHRAEHEGPRSRDRERRLHHDHELAPATRTSRNLAGSPRSRRFIRR
jgi:hypothetical protein